jgi:hypothetical protein
MNRSDFLKMIKNAGPSDRQATGEVNEIIEIFPYCQSAYMLLLKGLQNTSDVRFENQLRRSAMRIADREVLYYFLKEEKEVKKEPEPEIQSQDLSDNAVPDSQQVVIETAKNSEDLINEIEKSEKEGMPEETGEDELHSGQRPVFIHTESDNGDSAASLFFLDDESETEEEKVVFMDPGFSVPGEEEILLELDTENHITSSDEERVKEEQHYVEEEEQFGMKQKQSELIDKFILANPRIEPAREKSEAPQEDISKPFIEERGEFVTETLAKIYTSQGYYSRAIDIFEKLSLKFPEKSSYFASQIEKVKELIKK